MSLCIRVLCFIALVSSLGCGGGAYPRQEGLVHWGETRTAAASPPADKLSEANTYDFTDRNLASGGEGGLAKEAAPAQPSEHQARPEATTPLQRIVIYRANLRIATLHPAQAMENALAFAERLDGWLDSMTDHQVVVRVPAAHFRRYLQEIRTYGQVESEQILSQDVTEEFLDLEIRLRTALELRDRYAALLDKAQNVQDALAIEAELARMTSEIEHIKGRLAFLTNHVAFSTVSISFTNIATQLGLNQTRLALPFHWMRDYGVASLYN